MRGVRLIIKKDGFSLVEALLASSVLALAVTAMVGSLIYGQDSTQQSGEHARALFLAEEELEAVTNIRDDIYNELKYNQSSVIPSSSVWIFGGEGTEEIIGNFKRLITIGDVCRNSAGSITSCPASTTDPHLKQITASVSWPRGNGIRTVTSTRFLTNWESRTWTQTDWSGGAGQSTWINATRYQSDDTDIDYLTPGEIKLSPGAEAWLLAGGSTFTDSSDSDFNGGSFTSTTVEGSGADANIVLTQQSQWAADTASQSATTQDLNDLFCLSGSDCWAVGGSGVILHYNGISWSLFQDIGSTNLFGVYMTSTTDGWAVGASGQFYRYNGASWSLFQDIGATTINDVWIVSPTDGWAAANAGEIYHWNGTTWSLHTDLGGQDVHDIELVSPTDGWAVGGSGQIYRWNGSVWSLFIDIGSPILRGITMLSLTDGWIVGNSGTILHWNGSAWSSTLSPITENIFDVSHISANDIWAVGASGKIIHWGGLVWSEIFDAGTFIFQSIVMINANNGWTVGGGGRIYKYGPSYDTSGTFFSRIFDSGNTTTTWNIISWTENLPTGSDMVLATRTGNTPVPDGTWSAFTANQTDPTGSPISAPNARYIQYRVTFTRGASPTETPRLEDVTILYNAQTSQNLRDLASISASDIWAVGNSGEILHYNGTDWLFFTNVGTTLNGIYALASNDIWAVGNLGNIYHYNGTSWSLFQSVAGQLNDVAMISPTQGWAVGASNQIYEFNGTTWSMIFDGGAPDIFDIKMVSSTDGWAVGASGGFYRYDGATWSLFVDVGAMDINGLYMVSAADGWAVAGNGEIYRWNGTSWSLYTDIGSNALYDVNLSSPTDGWAVGENGSLYKWDGVSWTNQTSPTNRLLYSVIMISNTNGWAVGNAGVILHFVKGGVYELQGLLTSSAFNTTTSSKIQVIEWSETLPLCSPSCSVRLRVRAANDSGGVPGVWTDWYGLNGTSTYFTYAPGNLIPTELNGYQWIQYQVELLGDGANTPVVQNIKINYKY